MNKEEIENLKNKLLDFENKNVYIELQEAIQYHTTIHNAKILISDEKIFISNGKEQDFIVELHYLSDVNIENKVIYLEMWNDLKITLDY